MKKFNDTPYFEKHVFICMNTRDDGRSSCGKQGANVGPHAKRRVKELGLNDNQEFVSIKPDALAAATKARCW